MIARLFAAWQTLVSPAPEIEADRVGLLNDGSLIVLSPRIGTLVLQPETTDLVRDALWLDDGRGAAPVHLAASIGALSPLPPIVP